MLALAKEVLIIVVFILWCEYEVIVPLLPNRQWLPICKLHPMGIDDTVDKLRLTEGKKPNVRKSVHMAYERAMRHLRHVRSDMNFNPTSFI